MSTVLLSQALGTHPWYEVQVPPQSAVWYLPKVHGELVDVPRKEAKEVLQYLDHIEGGVRCYRRGMVTVYHADNAKLIETAWVYYAPTEDAIYAYGVMAQLFPMPSGKWSSDVAYNTKEEM